MSSSELVINGDPRALLGVSARPDRAEIESAYRRLASVFDQSRWHDDPELSHEAAVWLAALDDAKATLLPSAVQPLEPRTVASAR